MVIDTTPAQPGTHNDTARRTAATTRLSAPLVDDRRRYLWLALGLGLQLLAVGGRWDLALAAWLFPVFLLRFARSSRLAVALPAMWLVGAAGGAFWFHQVNVPFTWTTFGGALALGSVLSLPFVFDRLVAGALPLAGRVLAFPVSLAAVEFLLGAFGPFGTAYGLLAVTQHANLGLLQVISVTGPYAIALLIGVVATTVNHWWEHGFGHRAARLPLLALAVVVAITALGQARMAWLPAPSAPTVRIAGINPSMISIGGAMQAVGVPLNEVKALAGADRTAMRGGFETINAQLFADTAASAAAGAQIVVWSENAARVLVEDEQDFIARAQEAARSGKIYLSVAMNVILDEAPYGKNQTVFVGPDGTVLWTYEKHRPIPGLEPYEPGTGEIPVVETPFGRIANVICYDADFPALMHVDADIMLVPGADWPEIGWIHTKMSSLRAIENGYSLVRQDFNGSSQAFDRHGNVLGQQDTTPAGDRPWFVDVPIESDGTVYRAIGDIFAWLCLLATAGLAGLAIVRRRAAARP